MLFVYKWQRLDVTMIVGGETEQVPLEQQAFINMHCCIELILARAPSDPPKY